MGKAVKTTFSCGSYRFKFLDEGRVGVDNLAPTAKANRNYIILRLEGEGHLLHLQDTQGDPNLLPIPTYLEEAILAEAKQLR